MKIKINNDATKTLLDSIGNQEGRNGYVLTKVSGTQRELKFHYDEDEMGEFLSNYDELAIIGIYKEFDDGTVYQLAIFRNIDESSGWGIAYMDSSSGRTYLYSRESESHPRRWYEMLDFESREITPIDKTPELYIPSDISEDNFELIHSIDDLSILFNFIGETTAEWKPSKGGGGGADTYKHQVMLEAFVGTQVLGMIMTVETDFEEGLTKENITTKLTDYYLRRYPDLPYKTASKDNETTTMVFVPIDAIALRTFNTAYHFIEKEDGIIYTENFFPVYDSDVQLHRLFNVGFIVADNEGEKYVGLSAAILGTDSEGGIMVRDSLSIPLEMLSEALTFCVDVVEGTHSNVDPIL